MKSTSRNFTIFPFILASLVCISCFLAGEALADSVIVPNYAATDQPDNSAEAIFVSAMREQTVYSSSEFPAYPIIITEIRWRPDSSVGGPITAVVSNIQVSLSTTTKGVDQLNTIFAQNFGSDNTVVFSGAMNVASSFMTLDNGTKAFDIGLPLQTPFFFDPSKGNLLIDWRNFTGCNANLYDNGEPNPGDSTSRLYNRSDPNATFSDGNDSGGGVIELIYSPAFAPPTITSQPTNLALGVGETATFTVIAGGSLPLYYQWFFDDTNAPIGGVTNNSLTLVNVQTNQAGIYFVRVTNSFGPTFSSNAVMTVTPLPRITSQPSSQTVPLGSSATFTVSSYSSTLMSYQWFFNVTNMIFGATNASLTVTNVQTLQEGAYSVQITNIYGSTNSSVAFLNLGFVVPNYAAAVQLGNSAEALFKNVIREQTVYSASEFPAYPVIISEIRWRPDSLTAHPITTIVSNIQVSLSTTPNSPDNLNPVFAQNFGPDNTVVFSGAMNAASTFTNLSNGTKAFDIDLPLQTPFIFNSSKGNLLIDWRNFSGSSANFFDNEVNNISDAVSRIFSLDDPNATSSSGVDTSGGVIELGYSPVPIAPVITSQPTNQFVGVGENATFTVTASGAPPLNYQWFFNDTNNPIAGATNNSLTLVNLQTNQSGNYFVQVADPYGPTLSSIAVLTVSSLPRIASQPVSQTVLLGGIATFTVSAYSAAQPLTYEWYFNTTNLLIGVTNAFLTVSNVQVPQTGTYLVRVANSYGFTNSSYANLSIGIVVPNYAATNQPANSPEAIFRNVLREQTVYSASQFPGYPIIISDLRWRPDSSVGGPVTTTISNLQVSLSTTVNGPDQLNPIFAQNFGPDNIVVFSGAMNVTSSFTTLANGTKAFDIDLPLQTPFLFDPSKGNLLIDWRNFTGCSANLLDNGEPNNLDPTSRIYNTSDPNGTSSSHDTGGGVILVGFSPAPVAPIISSQPTNRTVIVGDSATFSAIAGPPPLTYQWYFNTNTPIDGATNAALTLTNIQASQAGSYSVFVTNAYGWTNSTFAFLTVNFPPAPILVVSTNVMGGNSVDVPVVLVANGNENTLTFSMNFNTQRLAYAGITLGSGAGDAALLPSTGQTPNGRLGVSLQLPGSETFASGTQEVVRVTFTSAILTGSSSIITPVNFTNQPVNKLLFDTQGIKLATNFVNGTVTILPSVFEADVTPRPIGDQSLDIFDWSQVGRFVAGLDAVTNASEFQRADCAPKSTSGDGQLKVTDWVQASRYGSAADAPATIGGPTAPAAPTILTGGPRTVSVTAGTAARGTILTLPVALQSQGNENAIGFSLNFDPAILKYSSTVKGSATASATMNVNTNQAALGILGVILALPGGNNFTNGVQEVVRITFTALTTTTNSTMAFADAPVLRAISDPLANELPANYSNATVVINPPPVLSISLANTNALLSWPNWATGFNLQAAGILPAPAWTNVSSPSQTNSSNISVTIPALNPGGYFRLQHP
jgi:Immunoglobulin domain/Cohesin domain